MCVFNCLNTKQLQHQTIFGTACTELYLRTILLYISLRDRYQMDKDETSLHTYTHI